MKTLVLSWTVLAMISISAKADVGVWQQAMASPDQQTQKEMYKVFKTLLSPSSKKLVDSAIVKLRTTAVPGISLKVRRQFAEMLEIELAMARLSVDYYERNRTFAGIEEDRMWGRIQTLVSSWQDKWLEVDMDEIKALFRYVANLEKPANASGWRCNLSSTVHGSPEECDDPQLGGEWIK